MLPHRRLMAAVLAGRRVIKPSPTTARRSCSSSSSLPGEQEDKSAAGRDRSTTGSDAAWPRSSDGPAAQGGSGPPLPSPLHSGSYSSRSNASSSPTPRRRSAGPRGSRWLPKFWPYGEFEEQDDLDNKLRTYDPIAHLRVYKPWAPKQLFGDPEGELTSVSTDGFGEFLGSGPVMIERSRVIGRAFEYPMDSTMLRVNTGRHLEISLGTPMRSCTDFYAALDVRFYGEFMEYALGVVCPNTDEWPKDVRLFLDKTKSPEGIYGYSFLVDPSFCTVSTWAALFLDAYHIWKHELPPAVRDKIAAKLEAIANGWGADMQNNELLVKFHMFTGPNGIKAYRPDTAEAFLEFIRVVLSHPFDYLFKCQKMYTMEDVVQLLRYKRGSLILSELIRLLHHYNFLAKHHVDRHLCLEGSSCCPLPTRCVRRNLRQSCLINRKDKTPDDLQAQDEAMKKKRHNDMMYVNKAVEGRTRWTKELDMLPPNNMLDIWKNLYAKAGPGHRNVIYQGLWDIHYSRLYSVWFCEFNVKEVMSSLEAIDKIHALIHQMSVGRPHAFGKMQALGPADDARIQGVWIFRGQKLPGFLERLYQRRFDHYKWDRVDISDPTQRDAASRMLCEMASNELDKVVESATFR